VEKAAEEVDRMSSHSLARTLMHEKAARPAPFQKRGEAKRSMLALPLTPGPLPERPRGAGRGSAHATFFSTLANGLRPIHKPMAVSSRLLPVMSSFPFSLARSIAV